MAGKRKGDIPAGKRKGNIPAGKRKLDNARLEGRLPVAKERARNRASPSGLVKLYDDFNEAQEAVVVTMGLGPMLNIKCSNLDNKLISWLAPKYDRFSRAFVIPGRGRIVLNAEAVYRAMGLPRGEIAVVYRVDVDIEARLGPILFPGLPSTPETTSLFTMLKNMKEADLNFKHLFIMYLVSTVLAPTTRNRVSNSCYPIMDKVEVVPNMNLCQFVCDKLHEQLSVGKLSAACLLGIQLIYVDSLDISALNIELPEGAFLVNVWSTDLIKIVLDADMKRDFSGYENLELKPHLSIDHKFFGGLDGFENWIDANTSEHCPKPRKEKVKRLVGEFASGMTRLLSNLVQGWTDLDECDAAAAAEQSFGKFTKDFGVDGREPPATSTHTHAEDGISPSKVSESPQQSVPIDPKVTSSMSLRIRKTVRKIPASVAHKDNKIKTPTATPRVAPGTSDVPFTSPRITRSVSYKARVSSVCKNGDDIAGSQVQQPGTAADDSDDDGSDDVGRFIIRSRDRDVEETSDVGGCRTFVRQDDSTSFFMPTQGYKADGHNDSLDPYPTDQTTTAKVHDDDSAVQPSGIVSADKRPAVSLSKNDSNEHTVDTRVGVLDGSGAVIDSGKESDANISHGGTEHVSKTIVSATVDVNAALRVGMKHYVAKSKKRKLECAHKKDKLSTASDNPKGSETRVSMDATKVDSKKKTARKRVVPGVPRSSPHLHVKPIDGGVVTNVQEEAASNVG